MMEEFKDEKNIDHTYKTIGHPPSKVNFNELKGYTLDDPSYKQLSHEAREEVEEYGTSLKNSYIHNGLPHDEVKLRQTADGKNQLPEKEKVPGIVKFLIELSSVFSLLLFFGAVLAFIGYGLSPDDQSNVTY